MFGVPPEQVRVVVPYLGGGYGGKTYMKLEPLAVALAKLAGRPVRVALRQEEEFFLINNHAAVVRLKSGASRDGRLVAVVCEVVWDSGACADIGPRIARSPAARPPAPTTSRTCGSIPPRCTPTCPRPGRSGASASGNQELLAVRRPHLFAGGTPASVPIVDDPPDLTILVAGGDGKHSVFLPTFGIAMRTATVRIRERGYRASGWPAHSCMAIGWPVRSSFDRLRTSGRDCGIPLTGVELTSKLGLPASQPIHVGGFSWHFRENWPPT
jgi:hypothetical protein